MKNLRLLNILWFQIGWWSLVLFASFGQQEIGLIIMAALVALHFYYLSTHRARDLWLMKVCTIFGVAGDLLLMHLEVISWPSSQAFPYWLIGLWFLFPLTLPYSFRPFLQNSATLPFLAVGAALSYLAGVSFQVLEFPLPILTTAFLLSAVWTFYLFIFRLFLNTVDKKILKIQPVNS